MSRRAAVGLCLALYVAAVLLHAALFEIAPSLLRAVGL